MRARHPGFRWALHVVGSLTVIVLALLSAAVISGSVVYVINDASEPPSETGHAAGKGAQPLSAQAVHQPGAGAVNTQGKPVRIVDPAFPPPETSSGPSANTRAVDSSPVTATTPAPAPTPQSPEAASATPSRAPAGAAQSPAATAVASHKEDAGTESSEQPAQRAAAREADRTADDKNNAGTAHAASRSAAGVKKRASNTVRSAMQASEQVQSTARRRIYDYYSSDDRDGQNAAVADFGNPAQPNLRDTRAQRGSSRTRARVMVRRQDDDYNDDDRSDDQARAAWRAQPRRAQSFFGFFGRDRSDNWQDDDRD